MRRNIRTPLLIVGITTSVALSTAWAREQGLREPQPPRPLGVLARLAQVDPTPRSDTAAENRASQGSDSTQTVDRLEEVIVTAQKRAESVQDVPSSISVLSGEQLENLQATRLIDYAAYVPGFQVDNSGAPGLAQITLRGVAATPFAGSSVGNYIDNSPMGQSSKNTYGSAFGLDLMPYDIERIEVLRGPQGTLYGASTMGGLVKYVLRSPSLDAFEARVGIEGSSLSGADDNGWGARGSVNFPVVEGKLGLRASYFNQTTPGFIDNTLVGRKDVNEITQEGGRAALLWQVTDTVSMKLSAMLQKVEADGPSTVTVFPANLRPIAGDLTTQYRADQPYEQDMKFFAAELSWDLGWANLISATSYAHTESRITPDLTTELGFFIPLLTGGAVTEGQLPFPSVYNLKKFTQEFQLASSSEGQLEWLLGAFYTDESFSRKARLLGQNLDGTPIPGIELIASFDEPRSKYTERAVFGDATYKFTQRFDVTAGVRFARNHDTFRQITSALVFTGIDETAADSADIFTYMVSPRWHLREDSMLYGRIASGYRPGGGNIALFAVVPSSVDADTLVNYEIGLKSELLDRKLLLDVALFYIDWKDIQISATEPSTSLGYLANGARAETQGLELTTVFRPIRGLRLGLNGAYTDAKLTEDVDPATGNPSWVAGARLPLSPRWSGALTADYEFPLRGMLRGQLGAAYRYVGDRLTEVETDPIAVRLKSYTGLDLNAGMLSDRWSLRLFAKNVTNERALLSSNSPGTDPHLYTNVLQPRMVGLSLDMNF